MDKKLTTDRIKQLEDNANKMKEGGYSDEDIQEMSNQFIEEYGIDDTTTVKKKDIPTQNTFGGSVSPTQDTRMDGNAIQSQQVDPTVNNQFNMMSFRNPIPETPIAHEDKVAYAKKAYRKNPLVPQGISDEDLNTVIEKNVTKNPDAFNQLAHQVKRKEERDTHIANASFDELLAQRNSELEHAQKTNTFYEYQQSRFGKAIGYLNDIKDGINISENDAEYIKSVAPTAFNELVPNGDLQTAINVNRANKQANDAANAYAFNEAKKSYLTQANIIDATQIATMSDQVKVGEVAAKQNQQKDIEIKNLQLKYPLRQLGNPSYGNDYAGKMDFPPEYYSELRKVNEKYDAIGNYLGGVHGTEFAKTQKDGIVSGAKSAYDIGIESLKVQNKNTYEQYLAGGQKSKEVKSIATKLGIESMLATGDPEIIRKAQVEQTDFFKKYPKELADDTIRRLSVEYFRHKGISRIVNDVTVPTSELNKIAENLPQQNKDWYYANIANTRDSRKFLGASTSIGISGIVEEPTNKNYATNSVQLMNPSGSINSLLEGFINPFIATGKLVGDIAGARTKKEIANENLSGQPILDQNPFNESEVNSKIKEIEAKPKKTYQDLVELQQAKEVKDAIPFGADVINRVSSTVGMVGAIALQSNMLSGAVGGIAGVSQEGLSAMQQGIQTETSAAEIAKYASQLKSIGAGTGQVAMAATMADDMYKNAIRLMPNDNQATQRVAYTALLTTMWGAVSRIMPFEKVFKGLTPEAESELANLAKEVTQKSVTKEALTNSLGKVLDKYILPFAKGTATDLAKVTAEMTGAQVITQAADAVANPSEFNPEAAKEAVVHTLLNTPIDMILVAGMNGIREVSKNPMSIATLSSLSNEKVGQQFIDVVQAQQQSGDITPKEATEKIQIVNTLQEISKKEIPEVQAIKSLTQKESDMYKVLLLNEKLLRKKMEDSKDAVLNKVYDSQIKESETKRQNILGEDYIVDSNYNLKSVEDANKEMHNSESITANGTPEIQGQPKTDTEAISNNNQAKNAELDKDAFKKVLGIDKLTNNKVVDDFLGIKDTKDILDFIDKNTKSIIVKKSVKDLYESILKQGAKLDLFAQVSLDSEQGKYYSDNKIAIKLTDLIASSYIETMDGHGDKFEDKISEKLTQFLLHEAIHSLNHDLIFKYENGQKGQLNDTQLKYIQQMTDIYDFYKNNSNESKSYGFTKPSEFIAEYFSNEKFRNELKRIKNSKSSVYDRIVNFISDLLGVDSKEYKVILENSINISNYEKDISALADAGARDILKKDFIDRYNEATGRIQTKNAEVGSSSEASGKVDATTETAPTDKVSEIEARREKELSANKKITEVTKGGVGSEKEMADQINAKYDAELKALEQQPTAETEPKVDLTNVVSSIMGNNGLAIMDADIRSKGEFKINNVSPKGRNKILNDFEELKKLHPEKDLQLIESDNSISIKESKPTNSSEPIAEQSKEVTNSGEQTSKSDELIKEKETAIEQLKKEKEDKIRELKKNKIDVELPPLKKVANSEHPIENMEKYESIKERLSLIDDIIKCL